MFDLDTRKWQDFQATLSFGLQLPIGVINTERGQHISFGCACMRDFPGLFDRHCLPFLLQAAFQASAEIQYYKCPLGSSLPFVKLSVQPLVIFASQSSAPPVPVDELLSSEAGGGLTGQLIPCEQSDPAGREDVAAKILAAKQLIKLYAFALDDLNKYGSGTLQLTAVREINSFICSLIDANRFEMNKVVDLILGFLMIVMNIDGCWAVIRLVDGQVLTQQKGETPCFVKLMEAERHGQCFEVAAFGPGFSQSLATDYQSGKFERIQSGCETWGWLGIENPSDNNADLLNIFARPLEIALEIHKLHHYLANQLNLILNALPGGVILINNNQRMHYCNKPGERLLGLSKGEVLGKSLDEIFHREFPYPLLMDGHNEVAFPVEYQSPDKSMFFECTYVQILDESKKAAGGLLLIFDRTEERALKTELARLDRASIASQLAASVAHEIRNPLTAAKGFLQLISQRTADPKIGRFSEIVLNELETINSIVTDFLSLARPAEPNKAPVHVKELLKSIKPLIGSEAAMCNIEFQMVLDDRELPMLHVDKQQIRQVLLNLAKNSIQAMKSGGKLEISAALHEEEKICIRVTDTGEGIPPAVLKNIFNPFFTTKETGTGMGLAICKNIIDSHGGRIIANPSPPGQGTVFEVILPVAQADQCAVKL